MARRKKPRRPAVERPAPAPRAAPAEEPAPPAQSAASAEKRPTPHAPSATPEATRRTRRAVGGALGALAVVAIAVVVVAGSGNRIAFDQGVSLRRVTLPAEAVRQGEVPLTVELGASGPLDADYWLFVHVESAASGGAGCRTVRDLLPEPAPTTWTAGQVITTEITLPILEACHPGRLEVFVGLYRRDGDTRLRVLAPATSDNRVHAGWLDVVASGADTKPRTITPGQMRRHELGGLLAPFAPWLLGLGLAIALVVALRRRRGPARDGDAPSEAEAALGPRTRRLVRFLPAVPFFLGILVVLEHIKDDAYISFRYAHNLVTGHGLVFNPGERLEGFTNFLWVLILAPFEWLGWDLFQVCEWLGTALGIVCLLQVTRFAVWVNGERRNASHIWAALWLGSSSSFVLWSKSGLEQPLAQLLPIAGAFLLWSARGQERGARRHLAAGLLMGAGCLTRPELHLLAILVGLPLLLDAVRARRIAKPAWLYVAGVLAITVPAHLFRYAYYGTLVPNTFYVKTGTGGAVWKAGLGTLHDMLGFNTMGVLALLAPLAFLDRRRLLEKSVSALIAAAFMAYVVKVGVDEMAWHRLFLPALPFLAVLAGLGAQNLVDTLRGGRKAAYAVAWAAVLIAAFFNFRFTYKAQNGFDGHGDLAGTYHPDLGKFLVRHERPGGLVAFQDMGSTPYHAPDINFLDFIGLVDGTVAHARHDHGLHAFLGSDGDPEQRAYDAEMREYFFRRNPEWTILTIYVPAAEVQSVAAAFRKNPGPEALGNTFNNNRYQFGIYADPRYRERYVHVRTWPRSAGYYLSLWRRKDLWERTPGEVVLDAPRPDLGGVRAKLENGLELLGSKLTPETLERHEAFFTTWWKLPGPMPSDVTFFVHVTREGHHATGDHVPGDWMYPADRWQEGQILEDRSLFQLPLDMDPGTYDVFMGVYRRSTGERLKVVEGPSDGDNRIPLGSFEVKRLLPVVHQLIPPTHTDVMRAHPERIIDSGRKPGS